MMSQIKITIDEDKIKILLSALEFYADEKNWKRLECFPRKPSSVLLDKGCMAQLALRNYKDATNS